MTTNIVFTIIIFSLIKAVLFLGINSQFIKLPRKFVIRYIIFDVITFIIMYLIGNGTIKINI